MKKLRWLAFLLLCCFVGLGAKCHGACKVYKDVDGNKVVE